MESNLKRLQNLGEGRQKHFLNTSSIEYLRVPFLKGMWNRGRRRQEGRAVKSLTHSKLE